MIIYIKYPVVRNTCLGLDPDSQSKPLRPVFCHNHWHGAFTCLMGTSIVSRAICTQNSPNSESTTNSVPRKSNRNGQTMEIPLHVQAFMVEMVDKCGRFFLPISGRFFVVPVLWKMQLWR